MSGLFVELGAHRVGETGRHDAVSGEDPSAVAVAWIRAAFPRPGALKARV